MVRPSGLRTLGTNLRTKCAVCARDRSKWADHHEDALRPCRSDHSRSDFPWRQFTVAAVFTRAPWVRTPEQVVESLFRIQRQTLADGQTPPRPENKRVWASLLKGKTAVIDEVAQEMQRRDPEGIKTRVALSDGERALQILVEGTLGVTLIPDLLHVLEKLWKAGYVFHPEGAWKRNSGFWTAPCASCSATSVRSSK